MTDAIRRARIAITQIAQPADTRMNALIKAVGPERALAIATSETTPTEAETEAFSAALHTARLGTPGHVVHHDSTLQDAINNWTPVAFAIDVDHTLDYLARTNAAVLIPEDDAWPAALRVLPEPPYALYVRGNIEGGLPGIDQTIAITGSRDATAYGTDVATSLADGVTGRGYTVITGGSYGIDSTATRAALGAKEQDTLTSETAHPIVVMASGLDRFYPSGNEELFERVGVNGIVITESPLGCSPTRQRFLARGRIIAALAGVTVVVEARWRSGALSVASTADTLGRAVAAVPGSVHSANSAGTHRLIAERTATIVTDTADVIGLLTQEQHGDDTASATREYANA